MSDQLTNALVATVLGSLLAVVLLVPVAAVQYRTDGRLGPLDLLVLVSAAIYVLSIYTYTLLPYPSPGYRCVGTQLELLGSIRGVSWSGGGTLGLLRDPAFLQVALNVLLFVPLGWFVRVVLRRGVLVATLVGLAVSLLVECTQRTGVWGIYPCPYRLFDVDDLVLNTLGALLGGLLALLLLRRRHPDRVAPSTISTGRRLVGLVADGFVVVCVAVVAALACRALLYAAHDGGGDVDRSLQLALMWGSALAVEAASVLLAGRTVGEWVISVRAVPRRRGRRLVPRLVKLATGVLPVFVAATLPTPLDLALVGAWVLVTAAAVVPGDHRGLSHRAARMDLEIT